MTESPINKNTHAINKPRLVAIMLVIALVALASFMLALRLKSDQSQQQYVLGTTPSNQNTALVELGDTGPVPQTLTVSSTTLIKWVNTTNKDVTLSFNDSQEPVVIKPGLTHYSNTQNSLSYSYNSSEQTHPGQLLVN